MNAKKLQKASKLFTKIQAFDKEIIEIDKFAMLVANGKVKTSFSMSFEGIKEQESEKVGFDEDGSLKTGGSESIYEQMIRKYSSPVSWLMPYSSAATVEKTDKSSISQEISENATLQIFGILLGEKQRAREQLIERLKELGVGL